jgi:hypothetical protein
MVMARRRLRLRLKAPPLIPLILVLLLPPGKAIMNG